MITIIPTTKDTTITTTIMTRLPPSDSSLWNDFTVALRVGDIKVDGTTNT